ncbi:MAG: type II toxin-antitoxin system VapC family toxin [Sphaerobacter sp.]|nr:type II toxin-antitoxin system VapC family toxin [Sphaerobacter sp.]
MIVVDASVAVKWLFPEEHSEVALALASATVESGEPLMAPPLLPVEVANVLRRRMQTDGLSLAMALQLFARFSDLVVIISHPTDLSERALTLATTYQLPAVYDAHYVALAQHLGCPLWTGDLRLARTLQGQTSLIRWIGDYAG